MNNAPKIVKYAFQNLLVLNVKAPSIKLQPRIKEYILAINVNIDVINVLEARIQIARPADTNN